MECLVANRSLRFNLNAFRLRIKAPFPAIKETACRVSCLFILSLSALYSDAQDYRKGWEYLSQNNRVQARESFIKALSVPDVAADAGIALMLLETFENRERDDRHWLEQSLKSTNDPDPYLYALWFNMGVAGNYGLKTPDQERFLQQLAENIHANETLRSSARYQLGHHYLAKHDLNQTLALWHGMSNVDRWAFSGPFENLEESGFDQPFPPIDHPKQDAVFKSKSHADISWFAPDYGAFDAWIVPTNHIPVTDAILYGQSFVTAPADMDVVLKAGFTGSFKAWVNDRLLISEPEARATDMDVYQAVCHLNKGVNRVLVQIGYENPAFASFIVRFTEPNGKLVQGLKPNATFSPYVKDPAPALPEQVPFFAESYFKRKIQENPGNLLNHVLLCETYLRAHKSGEALDAIDAAIAQDQNNSLLQFERFQCLVQLGNPTELARAAELLKARDPESFIGLELRYKDFFNRGKFEDFEKILNRRVELYGEDETVMQERINLASKQNQDEVLEKLVDKAFATYPDDPYFSYLKHNAELKFHKDPHRAMEVYRNFLNVKYVPAIAQSVAKEYFQLGMAEQGVAILTELDRLYPYDPENALQLVKYYSTVKNYPEAKRWMDKLTTLAPYNSSYWERAADLEEQNGHRDETLTNCRKSLKYQPDNEVMRHRIRALENKPDVASYFLKEDPYALLKQATEPAEKGNEGWYAVSGSQFDLVYPEGNSTVFFRYVVKILNASGVKHWKVFPIHYVANRQRLVVGKAEVVKPDGTVVPAEQSGSRVVFPNLQPGDGLILQYQLINSDHGFLSDTYWDKFGFSGAVPFLQSRFAILAPDSVSIQVKTGAKQDRLSYPEGFSMMAGHSLYAPPVVQEIYMPGQANVSAGGWASGLSGWKELASRYQNVALNQANPDQRIQKLHRELFPAGSRLGETGRAKKIYNWMLSSIRHLPGAFSESSFVPKRASKVLLAKEGESKDMSALYVALARAAGLKAGFAWLNKRDTGKDALPMPGFDDCLAVVEADGKRWYLDWNNPHLPFGCLSNEDFRGTAILIPGAGMAQLTEGPFVLDPPDRLQDIRTDRAEVTVTGQDLEVHLIAQRIGAIASAFRDHYSGIARQLRPSELQRYTSRNFSYPVTVNDADFGDLESLSDTARLEVNFRVAGAVVAGDSELSFKVPFFSAFLGPDDFPIQTRTQPLCFWKYENADAYEEEIFVNLPDGKAFAGVPADVDLKFNQMTYQLKYALEKPSRLRVTRSIKPDRRDVRPEDYEQLRGFVEEVVLAEGKRLVAR